MFFVDGGNDAVIFNGNTSDYEASSQMVQIHNSGLHFTSGYGIQGGVNADRAQIGLTSGSGGNVLFKVNNSEVARFTSGGLAIGGTGAANTLDDYEEGTFTPTFSGTSSAPSGVNYGSRNGSYTKIGRLVYVRMWLDLSSWSSGPTGNATITGLPFTTNSTSLNFPAVVIGYAASWDTDNTPGGGTADPNATFIYLRKRDSADARDNINTTVSANAMNGTENLTLTMVYETA